MNFEPSLWVFRKINLSYVISRKLTTEVLTVILFCIDEIENMFNNFILKIFRIFLMLRHWTFLTSSPWNVLFNLKKNREEKKNSLFPFSWYERTSHFHFIHLNFSCFYSILFSYYWKQQQQQLRCDPSMSFFQCTVLNDFISFSFELLPRCLRKVVFVIHIVLSATTDDVFIGFYITLLSYIFIKGFFLDGRWIEHICACSPEPKN